MSGLQRVCILKCWYKWCDCVWKGLTVTSMVWHESRWHCHIKTLGPSHQGQLDNVLCQIWVVTIASVSSRCWEDHCQSQSRTDDNIARKCCKWNINKPGGHFTVREIKCLHSCLSDWINLFEDEQGSQRTLFISINSTLDD